MPRSFLWLVKKQVTVQREASLREDDGNGGSSEHDLAPRTQLAPATPNAQAKSHKAQQESGRPVSMQVLKLFLRVLTPLHCNLKLSLQCT